MKREINGLVYRKVLEWLDDNISMYESFRAASEGCKKEQVEYYEDILSSCQNVRASFVSGFSAKKRKYDRKDGAMYSIPSSE